MSRPSRPWLFAVCITVTIGLALAAAPVARTAGTSQPKDIAVPRAHYGHDGSDRHRPRLTARPIIVGINGHLRDLDPDARDAAMARLRSIGVQVIREDFVWGALEPRPGEYAWTSSDALIRAAAEHGLRIMPILTGAPSWVSDSWSAAPATRSQVHAYARFVREVVGRYGSGGAFWKENPDVPRMPVRQFDLWNEPYAPGFWSTDFPDPAGYARLFKAAVIEGREANPTAQFLLESNTSSYASGAPPFLTAMFRAVPDLGRYADGISVHPYTEGAGPARCSRNRRPSAHERVWRRTLYQFCRIRDQRRILDANGARHTKIWITEIGWDTSPTGRTSVSEGRQATNMRSMFRLMRRRWGGLVSGALWYDWRDRATSYNGLPEGYGLLRADGSTKPALEVFRREIAKMAQAADSSRADDETAQHVAGT